MKSATFALLCLSATAGSASDLRPPAVPLVANDPYFSIWSITDRLPGGTTRHWTGTAQPLTALIRIDGITLRLMGEEPKTLPALEQQRLQVTPTRSIYRFQGNGVTLELTFLTPLLPDDLDILSRPVSYITWKLESADGRPHAVQLYFDASTAIAVNTPDQEVVWGRARIGSLDVLRAAHKDQPVLAKWGDNLRIDWGHFFVASAGARSSLTPPRATRSQFVSNGTLPATDDLEMPRADNRRDPAPVLALSFDLGNVTATPVERHIILAYDDQFSIEYFHRKLRPYWRRKGATGADLLTWAERDYASLTARAIRFDEALMADLRRVGGEKYEQLASLSYRQAIAGHKLAADFDGTPLFFPKENFSNGCISTVDVFYPSAPLFLLVSPKLLEASMQPIFDYAHIGRWKFPFAPHDLGTYPQANGQIYGGGEKTEENQMPVEESGNMLILTAALAEANGNTEFAVKYWTVLETWAKYLKEKGLDPENQLSTDDFAGHLAHNANLSIKAILALESFARLAEKTGHAAQAAEYHGLTRDYAARWEKLAADGDHYRLAFDAPGTWSQKYNLVWDRLLGFNLFPPEIARKELAYYKTRQERFGLPLDNRQAYTKLDWILWTATLADSRADFEALVEPAWRFANESPTRVPLSDWYWTTDAKQRGFQARTVVGGLFIKMLADPAVWKKWARGGGR